MRPLLPAWVGVVPLLNKAGDRVRLVLLDDGEPIIEMQEPDALGELRWIPCPPGDDFPRSFFAIVLRRALLDVAPALRVAQAAENYVARLERPLDTETERELLAAVVEQIQQRGNVRPAASGKASDDGERER